MNKKQFVIDAYKKAKHLDRSHLVAAISVQLDKKWGVKVGLLEVAKIIEEYEEKMCSSSTNIV